MTRDFENDNHDDRHDWTLFIVFTVLLAGGSAVSLLIYMLLR